MVEIDEMNFVCWVWWKSMVAREDEFDLI